MSIRFAWAIAPVVALSISAGAADLKSGIDHQNFDKSQRPQDDLFLHVNGMWLKQSKIPADRSADGAFFKLRDDSERQLRAIIEEAAKAGDSVTGEAKKVGDLYASFMDEERIEKLGITPIQPELDQVAAIKDKVGLVRTLASLQKAGVPGFFGMGVSPDAKQSDRYIVYMGQSGIGLPDESYYRDAKYAKIQEAYLAHITKMFTLAKIPDAEKAATRIVGLETMLAKNHWDRVRSRDADKRYNKYSKAELQSLFKTFEVSTWFEDMGVPAIEHVIVGAAELYHGDGRSSGSGVARRLEDVSDLEHPSRAPRCSQRRSSMKTSISTARR